MIARSCSDSSSSSRWPRRMSSHSCSLNCTMLSRLLSQSQIGASARALRAVRPTLARVFCSAGDDGEIKHASPGLGRRLVVKLHRRVVAFALDDEMNPRAVELDRYLPLLHQARLS